MVQVNAPCYAVFSILPSPCLSLIQNFPQHPVLKQPLNVRDKVSPIQNHSLLINLLIFRNIRLAIVSHVFLRYFYYDKIFTASISAIKGRKLSYHLGVKRIRLLVDAL
jgi:hypothetical protein